MVGPGIRQHGVALPDESFGKELAEITEPDNGNLELCGLREAAGELVFVIIRLSCVEGADAKGRGVVAGGQLEQMDWRWEETNSAAAAAMQMVGMGEG